MKFDDILKMHGFEPTEFRVVRHGYKEIDPLDTFRNDRALFDAYQAFQNKHRFADSKYIATFSPYHGTQALFLGVWSIDDELIPNCNAPATQRKLIARFNWQLHGSYYTLTEMDRLRDLSERLVIEWGGATVSWVQKITAKPVVAIMPPDLVGEFESYDATILVHDDLVRMARNPTSNQTWYNALRSVNGIYCITDLRNGRNYVGSAYGKGGIWGRWKTYAETGHGGNKLLVDLLGKEPHAVKHFQFSILEILSGTSTADDAIAKENLWKQKLATRVGGYNGN
jgi:hypothetical protein